MKKYLHKIQDLYWRIEDFIRYDINPLYHYENWKLNQTFSVGRVVEDCRYHPIVITSCDGVDIEGISLLDGSEPFCSLRHCGIRVLPAKEVWRRIHLYRMYGELGIWYSEGEEVGRSWHDSKLAHDDFVSKWREKPKDLNWSDIDENCI